MDVERLGLTAEEAAVALTTAASGPLPQGPSHRVVVGLSLRAARLLAALVALAKAQMEDCGEAVTRSIMEHAASAGWLVADPERFQLLEGAFARGWRILRDEGSVLYEELTDEERQMIAVPGNRLPDMPQRLAACGLESLYNAYRGLAEKSHGTLVAATAGVDPTLFSPGTYLMLGSHMICRVGSRVSDFLGWGIEDRLGELDGRVLAAIREES